MALYLAKKNASRTINQKGGADKDETRKDTDKLPFNSKKLKKSGGPLKEVIICNQSLPNLADSGTYSIRICKIKRMDSCTSVVRADDNKICSEYMQFLLILCERGYT